MLMPEKWIPEHKLFPHQVGFTCPPFDYDAAPSDFLRMSPDDAQKLGLDSGGTARITTEAGTALAPVEVTERMQPGHVSLPNGYGLDNEDGVREGVATNDLTSVKHRDPFAGTPFHKYVPARIEAA